MSLFEIFYNVREEWDSIGFQQSVEQKHKHEVSLDDQAGNWLLKNI